MANYNWSAVAITVRDVAEKVTPVPAPAVFSTPKDYPIGSGGGTVAVGDFNNDKKQDIVVTKYVDKTVSVFLGNGDGTFREKVDYGTGAGPVKVVVGDFNRDGVQDLVVTNTINKTLSILLGVGDGTFNRQSIYETGNNPFSVSVADLDKDGIADLVVTNYDYSNSVSVLMGNGDGTFRARVAYTTGSSPANVSAADFNKDGKIDLAVSNLIDNTVSILLGNGDGSFQTQRAFAAGAGPQSIIAVDVNHDDKLDLIVQNYYGAGVSVLLGNGDGTFQGRQPFPVGNTPCEITVADVNGDDIPDIVAPNYADNTVSILIGNGDGTFLNQQIYQVGNSPNSVATGDFNGDGQPDLVVANNTGKSISVLLNNTHAVPTITGADASQSTDSKTPIKPFAGVTITDDNAGATEKLMITMTGGGGTLAGEGLSDNGDGSYTLAGSAADVAKLLQALTYTPDGKQPGAVTTFTLVDNSIVDGKAVAQSNVTTVSVTNTGPFIPTITAMDGLDLSNLSTSSEAPIRPFLLKIDGPRDAEVHSVKIEVTGAGGKLSYEFGDLPYSEEGQYYWGKVKYGDFEWLLKYTTFIPKAGAPATQSQTFFKITFYADENLETPLVSYDQIRVVNIDPPVAPTITVARSSLTATADFSANPFADVTIVDNNAGATEKLTITMTGGGGTLAGEGLTDNGGGIYTLAGSAAEVASQLRNLTFKPDGKDQGDVTTFSLVSISLVNGVEVANSAPVTVAVTELAPPVITSAASAGVDENVATSAVVYKATATDADSGSNLVWSISGGADKQKFVIDSATGEVTFVASPDFERPTDDGGDNVYDIVVRASDGSLATEQAVAITVRDVAEKVTPVPAPAVFSTPKDTATGKAPQTVAVGDFNGDKKQDIAVTNYTDKTVSVLLGNGDGTFREKVDYGAGTGPVKVAVGDFNRDGVQDLVITNVIDKTLSILLGVGDGTFHMQSVYETGNNPFSVSVADLDKDGIADLMVTNYDYSNSVSVLMGNSDGTFRTRVAYATGSSPANVSAADFNKDGVMDLAVSNLKDSTISILLGNGDGSFQAQRAFAAGAGPQSIISVDVNHDDKLDLVVQNYYGASVSVLLGNGDGTFQGQQPFQVGHTPGAISVTDFNGDGIPDIVAPNYADNTVSVLLGNGDGTFVTQQVYNVGTNPGAVATGDFNGDGQPDFVVVNMGDDTASVLLNESKKAPAIPVASHVRNDFNGDGKSDILLQDGANGDCFVWQMNGLKLLSDTSSGYVGWRPPNNNWHAVGTGDFDGDGKSDILLQDGANNDCFIWQMDSLAHKKDFSGYVVGKTDAGRGAQVKATGDFDGDGRSDLLLQDGATGDCFVWLMDGLTVKASAQVGWTLPNNKWTVAGTGDFNGDGKSDILLQDGDNGDCFVWQMDGLKLLSDKSSGYVGWTPPSNQWRAVGTGDFNGDGKSDILLQDGANGACFVWEMNGLTLLSDTSSGYVGWTPPNNQWRAMGTGDYNGDGKSDILLQDGATGDCFVWQMNGLQLLSDTSSGFVGWRPPTAEWHATA